MFGTTPSITIGANKIYIYINFQGAAGAAVLVLGLDLESHCPKAFLILEARGYIDSVQKRCRGIGGVAVAPAEPPVALLLIRVSQVLRSSGSSVSMPLSKQVQSLVQRTLGIS